MNKLGKIALAAGVTGAALGAGLYALCSVVDGLLVDKNKTVSEDFAGEVSGMDNSRLKEICAKNMKWLEGYGYEKHYIYSDAGQKLVGYLMKPEKPSDVYVFGAHGYRSDGKREFNGFAQYYLKKGFNVFFPDHVASGESEGTYIGFGYYESKDCFKWLNYIKETFGENIQIILHGVSMGAATVMLMSGSESLPENVKMAVSDCGYTSCKDEFMYKLKEMKVPGKAVLYNTLNVVNKRKAGYSFDDVKPVEAVKNAKIPMLFVHGTKDNFVPFFMGNEVYKACGAPYKEFLVVEGADHASCSVDGWDEYEKKLDFYIDKFIEK